MYIKGEVASASEIVVRIITNQMNRFRATRIIFRRSFLNYKPKLPKFELEETPAIGDAVSGVATSIMNGAKGQPVFPPGTMTRTFKNRIPFFFGGLAGIFVIMGWPSVLVLGSRVVHKVPPSDTAMVHANGDGTYECDDIGEVHMRIEGDD